MRSDRLDNVFTLAVLAISTGVGAWGCSSSSGGGGSGGQSTGGATSSGGVGSGGKNGTGGANASGGSQGGPGDAGSEGSSTASGGSPGTGGDPQDGGGADASGTGHTGGASTGGSGDGGRTGRGSGGGPSGTGGGAGKTGAGGSAMTGGNGGANSGGMSDATIIPDPSWTCGMPEGIAPPTAGTLVFTVTLTIGATHEVGDTQYGHRRQLDVKGGQITGDRLQGTVLTGGLDYELTLSSGAMEVEEINILKISDNTTIFMRTCGVASAGDAAVRIVPDIEAPTSSTANAWLNTAKLVGTRVASTGKIQLDIYDVSKVPAGGTKVQLKDPAGVPNVSWDCLGGNGTKGNSVFTENVTLGSTVGVSGGKRGSRNIIPITGGTTTGKVAGSILNGGADYQLAGSSGTTLDARYTLAPSDGEFIIVRNCGPIDSLVPVFEARAAGPYAFLNDGKFLSSSPGSSAGGVSITFYERK
jgi:hypothetical protein